MYNQIEKYMNQHLSEYLCGFRKGYSTEYCLNVMKEKWKKELDKHNILRVGVTSPIALYKSTILIWEKTFKRNPTHKIIFCFYFNDKDA